MSALGHPYEILAATGPLVILGIKAFLYGFALLVVGCMFYWVAIFTMPLWYPFVLLGCTIYGYIKGTRQAKAAETQEKFKSTTSQSRASSSEFNRKPQPAKDKEEPHWILGVQKGASREEISKAYRALIVKNHPDKVASLDPELQRVATERTKKIHQAYSDLCPN